MNSCKCCESCGRSEWNGEDILFCYQWSKNVLTTGYCECFYEDLTFPFEKFLHPDEDAMRRKEEFLNGLDYRFDFDNGRICAVIPDEKFYERGN